MLHNIFLSKFKKVDPLHRVSQIAAQAFLADLHSQVQAFGQGSLPVQKLIERYSVDSAQIESRYVECEDIERAADKREIYRVQPDAIHGSLTKSRTKFFSTRAEAVLEDFYPSSASPPDHLIHVTCTGYAAPSPVQKLVAKRGWSSTCTNAYHMGCFASMPAIRIACGQVRAFGGISHIVHTEMCSLHMNPADHSPEQIVVQSLFADGHMKYEISSKAERKSFEVLHLQEQVVPDTAELMTWSPAPWGLEMTLSRQVPNVIGEGVLAFAKRLVENSGFEWEAVRESGLFAVHPGGPKIIDLVLSKLGLKESQISHSRHILKTRGNMSSATLPHIWQNMIAHEIPLGTPIVSLAFGPGLTLFGAVFRVAA